MIHSVSLRTSTLGVLLALSLCSAILAGGRGESAPPLTPPAGAVAAGVDGIPGEGPEVLQHVMSSVKGMVSRGDQPIVVFDLDSTLLDHSPRIKRIIHDWSKTQGSRGLDIRKRLEALPDRGLPRKWKEALALVTEVDDATYSSFVKFAWPRYMANRYVLHDAALPGAVRFVKQLEKAGASIVYLTAREKTSRAGTLQNLAKLGFPVTRDGALLLTNHIGGDGHAYKGSEEVRRAISSRGRPVAFFDDRLENLRYFHGRNPGVLGVHVRVTPGDPTPPDSPFASITRYVRVH